MNPGLKKPQGSSARVEADSQPIESSSVKNGTRDSIDSTNCGCSSDMEKPPGKQAGRNWDGPWKRTPGRLLGTGLIRLYQLTLSGFIGNSCRHQPTCSEYGYEAIARHGLLRGGWLTSIRVVKCNPFGTSGFDPVPKD